MSPEEKRELEEYKKKVDKLESILYGINNDPRFKAKVRSIVIEGEHTANKPKIVSNNGKTYNLQIV